MKDMKELIKLVAEMRRLQKLYFKNRDSLILRSAKEAEKAVDDYLAKHERAKEDTQTNLFG